MAKIGINKNHIKKFEQQRRSVGLLQFKLRDDQNFSKWYALTENLIIKSFGQKSNQLSQLKDIYDDMHYRGDYYPESRLDTGNIKGRFKNLLTVLIEELELDMEGELGVGFRKNGNMSIKIKNAQTVNQMLNVSAVINNVIEYVRQTEPDSQRAEEAELKLKELENEVSSKSPTWSKIKDILIWLLNFGRDAFLRVLPIILEKLK